MIRITECGEIKNEAQRTVRLAWRPVSELLVAMGWLSRFPAMAPQARAPSGAVIKIEPGIYFRAGEEPGSMSVRPVEQLRQVEITYAEFQRLKAVGALKEL